MSHWRGRNFGTVSVLLGSGFLLVFRHPVVRVLRAVLEFVSGVDLLARGAHFIQGDVKAMWVWEWLTGATGNTTLMLAGLVLMALAIVVFCISPTRGPLARGYIHYPGLLRDDSVNVRKVSLSEDKGEAIIEWQSPIEHTYHVHVRVVWGIFGETRAQIVEQTPQMVKIRFLDQMNIQSPAWEFSFIAQ